MILKIRKFKVKIENFSKLFFFGPGINNLYPLPLGAPRYDCQRNMIAERPIFRIYHPKTCALKTYAILACNLSAHGFGWKFWFDGNLDPKFCIEASFCVYKQTVYHLCVGDVEKIDAKPIFTVPDMMPNLAIMSGTVKISAALLFFLSNTDTWHCTMFMTIIVDRPCNVGGKLSSELFFWAKPCVWTCTLVGQICMNKQGSDIFFWFVFRQMFLHHDIIYMHNYLTVNSGVQTPVETSLRVDSGCVHVWISPKLV